MKSRLFFGFYIAFLGSCCAEHSHAQKLTLRGTIKAHDSALSSVAFSRDGKSLLSGSADKKVKLWNVANEALVKTFAQSNHSVMSVAFNPDGKRIAVCESHGAIKIIEVLSGKVASLEEYSYFGYGIAFSPDGELIAAACSDKTIRFWKSDSGKTWKKIERAAPYKGADAIEFSPNGKILAVGSYGKLTLIEIAAGRVITVFEGVRDNITSIAFSPDGNTIATPSVRDLKLWGVNGRKEISCMKGHPQGAYSLVFTPDGRVVASGGGDGDIRLWNAATGKNLFTTQGHGSVITTVAISPDGRILASGSYDRTIKLWNIEPSGER